MIPDEWFVQAHDRIRRHVVRTPLSHDAGRGLFLKWENRQVTGSFKARGAINKVLSLEAWEREAGLVAASAGNHGQGTALAARLTNSKAEIYVPSHAVPAKIEAIRALGGDVRPVEGGYGEAEAAAKARAADAGKVFISPYNDAQVIAGQGTTALEILEQLGPAFGAKAGTGVVWIIPLSGGGLMCGCAAAAASKGARHRFIGVQPAASPFTYNLFHHGTQAGVQDDPTLADGLSGPIDSESITVPMIRELVDDVVTVTEEQIEEAMALAWWTYGERLEGSAAAALAAVRNSPQIKRPCVVVLTGSNVQPEVFESILARHPKKGAD